MGKDTRFQRNDYLLYAYSMHQLSQLKKNLNVCGKLIKDSKKKMVEDIYLYMRNMRGSAAYWNMAYRELLAKIKSIGTPHYFLTFSCNDLHWDDMKEALHLAAGIQDKSWQDLDVMEVQKLIEQYPLVVSRQFMIRVDALLAYLKADHPPHLSALKGKMVDWWWRIEFQSRGSPHLHLCI